MPRFVILEHDHPELHWDLMLERGTVLWTWRLPSPPQPGLSIPALRTFDHRLMYLDYEGPISGDRGKVVRWDSGRFSWELETDRCLRLHLEGRVTRGLLRIDQIDGENWHVEVMSEPSRPETEEGRSGLSS